MSEQPEEQRGEDTGGTVWDDPNRQVLGLDPAWVEGTGGGEEATPKRTGSRPTELDDMTKEDLLEYAQELGVTPANKNMTKDELRSGVDGKLAEGG